MEPVDQNRHITPESAYHDDAAPEPGQDSADSVDTTLSTTLSFTVRFRRTRCVDPRTQAVNITFRDTFTPSDAAPLNITLNDDYCLDFSRELVTFDPESPNHDVVVVESAIDLFGASDPDSPLRAPWRRFVGAISSTPRGRCLVILVLSLLLVIVVLELTFSISHPWRCHPAEPSNEPFARGKQRVRIQHAPLPLLDDITTFLQHYAETPLPFFVGIQDLVNRHYLADVDVPRPPTRAPQPSANITTRVFLSHVYTATSQLCDAVQDWLALSRTELPEDVALLCRGLHDAVAELSALWGEASLTLAVSWLSSFELAVFHLREAIEETSPPPPSPPPLETNTDDTLPITTTCFYNQTSYTFIRKVYTHLFSAGTQEQSPFAAPLYDAAEQVTELSDTLLAVITRGSLLLQIVSDGDVLARSREAQGETKHARASWFVRSPSRAGSRSSVERAVANIAPAYDEAAPLLRAAVAATWVVTTTRVKLHGLIDDFEELGDRTAALCSGPVPTLCGNEEEWWRGLPWVTETTEHDGLLTRTFWYLPDVKGWDRTAKAVSWWAKAQLRRTQMEWRWAASETERYWRRRP